ncbi:MAG: hypothetical protein N2171_08490 [Clostridia bacterium]|nr:hypothetical protein [Clostridia bacterium]
MKFAQISLKRQFFEILYTHFYVTGLSVVFGFGAFWWFLSQYRWHMLFSIIFTAIYFCALYSKAYKIAVHDAKGYAKTKTYPFKGFVLAVVVCGSIFILWGLYRISWVYMTIDGEISGYTGMLYNSLFIFWTFPFNGIMMPYKGGIFWYSHFVIYLLPIAAAGAGYYAGYKKFSIYEKLLPMMYEKTQE